MSGEILIVAATEAETEALSLRGDGVVIDVGEKLQRPLRVATSEAVSDSDGSNDKDESIEAVCGWDGDTREDVERENKVERDAHAEARLERDEDKHAEAQAVGEGDGVPAALVAFGEGVCVPKRVVEDHCEALCAPEDKVDGDATVVNEKEERGEGDTEGDACMVPMIVLSLEADAFPLARVDVVGDAAALVGMVVGETEVLRLPRTCDGENKALVDLAPLFDRDGDAVPESDTDALEETDAERVKVGH